MSFEPIPEPSLTSDYLKIKENEKHRIRIMGTSKDPATFIQGWEAWDQDNKPHREPYELGKPCSKQLKDIDRNASPKLFWMFTVYHVDEERAKVFQVTQRTIKDPILAYSKNPKWGDLTQYDITITRTGKDMNNTKYSLTPDPDKTPPSEEMLKAIKEARIDCSAVFKTDSAGKHLYPMGALTEDAPAVNDVPNDQSNIDRLRSIVTED